MTPGKALNREVLVAEGPLVQVSRADIEFLEIGARLNNRNRMRLCAHSDIEDRIHEMLIVLTEEAYVRPHKHLNKSESGHVVEGQADLIVFDEAGALANVIELGDYASARQFFYRMASPSYHMLLIRSAVFVFHEVTNGPFDRADTVFAPWAPEDANVAERKHFIDSLKCAMESGRSSVQT